MALQLCLRSLGGYCLDLFLDHIVKNLQPAVSWLLTAVSTRTEESELERQVKLFLEVETLESRMKSLHFMRNFLKLCTLRRTGMKFACHGMKHVFCNLTAYSCVTKGYLDC